MLEKTNTVTSKNLDWNSPFDEWSISANGTHGKQIELDKNNEGQRHTIQEKTRKVGDNTDALHDTRNETIRRKNILQRLSTIITSAL